MLYLIIIEVDTFLKKWPVDLYNHWKISRFLLAAAIERIAC
jgi:hypothetical protein